MSEASVTVVGAGIVGVASTLWLQRAGFKVTLIDSGGVGEGASFGNAGNISPGAVVPYLIPGIWREAPGWLLDPQGPLAVRPGYFLKVLPWLSRAVQSAKEEAALATSRASATNSGSPTSSTCRTRSSARSSPSRRCLQCDAFASTTAST